MLVTLWSISKVMQHICDNFYRFLLHENSALRFLTASTWFKMISVGTKNITGNVVGGSGYKSESQWYAWYNNTQHCVQKLTGACAWWNIFQDGLYSIFWRNKPSSILNWRIRVILFAGKLEDNSSFISLTYSSFLTLILGCYHHDLEAALPKLIQWCSR